MRQTHRQFAPLSKGILNGELTQPRRLETTSKPVAALLSSLLAVSSASAQSGDPPKADGRLRQAVLEAKANSLTQIRIPPPASLPTGVDDIDTVAADYTVIVARPVQTIVSTVDSESIVTWYKVKAEETVIRQANVSADRLPELKIPPELLPLAANEFVMREAGGAVTIDGITVDEPRPINLGFIPGQRFLLFLDLEAGGTFAALAALGDGVYFVAPDGTLRPLARPDRPLVREVETRFSNRLDFLRPYLKLLAPGATE